MYKILNQLNELAGMGGVLPAPAINTDEPEATQTKDKVEIFRMDDDEPKADSDCGCGGDDAESCECDDSSEDPVEDMVNKFRDFLQQNLETLPGENSDPAGEIDDPAGDSDDPAGESTDDLDDPAGVTDDELDGMDATEDELDVSDELEAVENEENEIALDDPAAEMNPEDPATEMNPEDPAVDLGDGPDELEEPNRQGTIRVIKGAHLVYKRKTPDGFYEELWFYNIGKETSRDELELRKEILAGTDIPESGTKSDDGAQSYEIWTSGNGQMMKVVGLPN